MKRSNITIMFLIFLISISGAYAKDVDVVFNFPLDFQSEDIEVNLNVGDGLSAYEIFVLAAEQESIDLDVVFYDFDGDGINEAPFINGVAGLAGAIDYSAYWQFSIDNEGSWVGVGDHIPLDGEVISLDYFEGEIDDALEWLLDNQNVDGSFGPNIFQDTFALMALSSYDGNEVDNGLTKLISDLQAGGFDSALDSSLGMMAMDANDETYDYDTRVQDIIDSQLLDGGFKSGTSQSDVDTTSWVVLSLAQLGYDLPISSDGLNPIDYLLSAQNVDGGFGYNQGSTSSVDFTMEALLAMAAGDFFGTQADDAFDWLEDKRDASGCFADGFRNALGYFAYEAHGKTTEVAEILTCLEGLNMGDGSFGRSSNPSNTIDTALAYMALNELTMPLKIGDSISSGSGTGASLDDGVLLNDLIVFTVDISNDGDVVAKDIDIDLDGIPQSYILEESTLSVDEIEAGASNSFDIYVRLEDTDDYNISAEISSASMKDSIFSNWIFVEVIEAQLSAVLGIGD